VPCGRLPPIHTTSLFHLWFLGLNYFLQIVLGVTAWFLSYFEDTPVYPSGRLVFTVVVSSLAFISATALIFLWTHTPRHILVSNSVIFGLAFLAAFGALVEFDRNENWNGWENVVGERYLDCWKATEAFCFISGSFWLGGAIFAYPAVGERFTKPTNKPVRAGSEIS